MNPTELVLAVRNWLDSTPMAGEAADWMLNRAEAVGEIPKEPTLKVSEAWHDALSAFFSARFVRLSDHGQKITLYFDRWEHDQFGRSGVLLPVLAESRGRVLVNRRLQREQRETQIKELLHLHVSASGLPGQVAHAEMEKLKLRQGRFWSRSERWSPKLIEREIGRYFKLLHHVEELRSDAGRIERIVHVARVVAGDTHWLRPRNRIWRDLAEDILRFDAELNRRLHGLERREALARALSEFGIVENLTSVMVMVFGHFALHRRGAVWNWPKEAARASLPVWLAATHFHDSTVVPESEVTQVISVENETSFLDLVERHGSDTRTVLVYTEGQANRAVVMLLRLFGAVAPTANFIHQGDLDLPGVRDLQFALVTVGSADPAGMHGR